MAHRDTMLEDSTTRYNMYVQAEKAILEGAQSYTIANRTLTRADLRDVQSQIEILDKKIIKLERSGAIRMQKILIRYNR